MLHPLYIAAEIFSVFAAAFAFWKGGRPERLVAAVIVINVIVGNLGQALIDPAADELFRLCNDGVAAGAILAITIRYGAVWMGAVMLFYAVLFALHSYYLVLERDRDIIYAWVNNTTWQAMIWSLIIGTAVAWRARTRSRAAGPVEPQAQPAP